LEWSLLTLAIPEFSSERFYARKPRNGIRYSTTDGMPIGIWRMCYTQNVQRRYDTLLIDIVPSNPSQTSDFYKPLRGLTDPSNVTQVWTTVGWVRADLDPDGRILRLWGEDGIGRFWVWSESQPFPATVAPAVSVDRQKIE
jgi:hypothetical protein